MKKISIAELMPDTFFTSPVFLFKNYMVIAPNIPVSKVLINRLKKWGYQFIYSQGDAIYQPPPIKQQASGDLKLSDKIKNYFTNAGTGQLKKIESAIGYYFNFLKFTREVFHFFKNHNTINLHEVNEHIQQTIHMLNEHRDALLLFSEYDYPVDNYLTKHSANVTLLALAVGNLLRYNPAQLLNIGVAAFLHDIGMIRIPEKIYLKAGQLNYHEREIIQTHCITGYNILKALNVPEIIARAALEHHERLDGSGYPKNVRETKMSTIGRIIAVTCSFEAAISTRPHKPAVTSQQAILDIATRNRQKYDLNIIKALVRSVPFPKATYNKSIYAQHPQTGN
jgi:putative nucleotidyltransferase with HDIG domain